MHSLLASVPFVWVERSQLSEVSAIGSNSQVQSYWQLNLIKALLVSTKIRAKSARSSCYSCFVFSLMQHHGRTAPRFYQAPESAISSTASQDCVLNGKTRSPLPEFGPLQLTKAIAASENHDNVPYKTYKRITVSRSRQNFSSYVTSV